MDFLWLLVSVLWWSSSNAEEPNIHITMGVMLNKINGAVLYSSSIPIFAKIGEIPKVGLTEIGLDRICGYNTNMSTRKNSLKLHTTIKNIAIDTTSPLCALSHEAYEMLHVNKELLRSLEGLHESKPEKERFRRESSPGTQRKTRAALAEPLGNLLEFITGNPSAATFREVSAHVNYLEQFTKRIRNAEENSKLNYIKIVNDVSKTTKETINGFMKIQGEMREVQKSFDILQQKC
ncbi:unnamed protein product [Orchesella dallaii]|uniref:Uncharacterized protein n=1 Tax=Orchesella dallaii TaxID=48710 RepID=A0ABP1QXM2_9HEXA